MNGAAERGLAVVCAALAWFGPATADPLETRHVLELGGERWRVAGTLSSSVTGAELVIFEEAATRRSKIARPGDPPFPGVAIVEVSSDAVLLEVEGRAVRLAIGRGLGTRPGLGAAPAPPAPDADAIEPPPPPGFARLRLSVAELAESVRVVRQALRSGDIGLGRNDRGIFGVVIHASPPGGIIERLGLRPGDVVVAIDGRPAASEDAALALLDAAAPDRDIAYAFRRGEAVGQGVLKVVADRP